MPFGGKCSATERYVISYFQNKRDKSARAKGRIRKGLTIFVKPFLVRLQAEPLSWRGGVNIYEPNCKGKRTFNLKEKKRRNFRFFLRSERQKNTRIKNRV